VIIYKEKINFSKLVSLILGIAGLLKIFSLTIDEGNIIPALITILAGVCGGTEIVFTKKISNTYHPIQLTTVLYAVDIVINGILFIIFSRHNFVMTTNVVAWSGLLMYAVSGLLAFSFVSVGYKFLEPSVGGIIGLLEIPFSITFSIIIFKDTLTPSIIIGALLIIVAASLPNIKSFLISFDRQTFL